MTTLLDPCIVPDALGLYLAELETRPLLSEHEETALAQAAMRGDASAKVRMIEQNLRLVVSIAKQYQHLGLELEDLISEGNCGLIRAIETFDPEQGRLTTYATFWIKQAIRRALDNTTRLIRLPAYQRSRLTHLARAKAHLAEETGTDPSIEQLAEHTGISPEVVTSLLLIDQGVLSLDQPISNHNESFTLALVLPDPDLPPSDEMLLQEETQATLAAQLAALLTCLTAREQQVVRLRFGLDGEQIATLAEIGRHVGLSKERVRQLLQAALGKLYHQCLCTLSSITLISMPHAS